MGVYRLSGDWKTLSRDLEAFPRLFTKINRLKYQKAMKRSADFYVKSFNHFMNIEGHRSLAKARRTKLSSGGQNYDAIKVYVPNKAIDFDTGPMRKIDIKRPIIKAWVIKKWAQKKVYGRNRWYATQIWAGQSKVYGKKNNPKGYLITMSHMDKYGFSILEQTNKLTNEYFREQLRLSSRLEESLLERKLLRRSYNLRIEFAM